MDHWPPPRVRYQPTKLLQIPLLIFVGKHPPSTSASIRTIGRIQVRVRKQRLRSFIIVLPKFSSELMQRTGTDRTEPKVRFSPVPVLQFWLRFGSQFSEFSKIPEPFENRSKFRVGIQKKACKIAYVWCRKVIIHPVCRNKAVIELYRQGFRSFEWLVITKYGKSLSISCFLALVPSKSIRTKKFKHKLLAAISFRV